MRRSLAPWVLALAILLTLGGCRADPAVTTQGPQGTARWTLSNGANYTLDNLSWVAGQVALAWQRGSLGDTAAGEFALARSMVNVDLASNPGSVVILNTSHQGPLQTATLQPNPSQLDDNYLYNGGSGNANFGSSANFLVGRWGPGNWNRGVLRFQGLGLPANATVQGAYLELYMYLADTLGPMDIGVYPMTSPWTEAGSNWNTEDGSTPWNTTGGDFDPTAVDVAAAIQGTVGWYRWNVTSVVRAWATGGVNHGVMVREVNDNVGGPSGRKDFYSSDVANATLRPRLVLNYTTPSSMGLFESRVLDPGAQSLWGGLWWNATVPGGTTVAMETRSGNASVPDGTWSPWVPAPAVAGDPVASPSAHYFQYRVRLFTPSSVSPELRDVGVNYFHRVPLGHLQTQALLPTNLTAWGRLDVNWTRGSAGTLAVHYSEDGGNSWVVLQPGENATGKGSLLLRLDLGTTDATQSPTLGSFTLGFTLATGTGPGPGNPSPIPFPWWVLVALVPVPLLVAWTVGRRTAFHPGEVFLIHADGRLISRIGPTDSSVRDEVAVSGMFTVVAQFVRDSFGKGGAGGELKRLTVDQREVSIARGQFLFMALVGEGRRPRGLEATMLQFLRAMEVDHGATLRSWDGMARGLEPVEEDLRAFMDRGWHGPRSQGGTGA